MLIFYLLQLVYTLLPKKWQVLGPFPHGTRELGYDSLSSFGGFESLEYSDQDVYPSELSDDGYVGWSIIETNDHGYVTIQYMDIKWDFHQLSFGIFITD
jgi:hypothetical protein